MFNNIKPIDDIWLFGRLGTKRLEIVFGFTAVTAFLTYGFSMSNGFINGDGLVYGFYYNVSSWDVGQGRWALLFFSGRFITSWFEGILSILSLAVSAVLIVKFFDIKSVAASTLVGILVAAQTHFAQWQGSPYVLFPYSVGFMSAVAGAYLMWNGIKNRKWILGFLSGVVLAFSLGIYQAYFPVAMAMLYLKVLMEVMHGVSIKKVLQLALKALAFLGVAGILYMIFLKAAMAYYHIAPVEARGWGDMLKGEMAFLVAPLATLKSVYEMFFRLLLVDGIMSFSQCHKIAYMLVLIVDGYFFVRFAVHNKMRAALTALGFLAFPIVVLTIRMLTDTVIPWSMYPGMFLVSVFAIVFLEDNLLNESHIDYTLEWIVAVCIIFLAGESIYISNIDYVNLQKRNLKTQTACIRLLDRIETADGYYPNMPIVFYGALQNIYPNPLPQYEEKLKGYEAYIMDWIPYKGTSSMYASYITDYLGVPINTPSNYREIIDELGELEDFKGVDVFPSFDCTYLYNDVLVIKLSD